MDTAQRLPVERSAELQPLLSREKAATIMWESAWSALFRAFLVQTFGTIVVGFISDIFSEMSPSAPPGLGHSLTAPSPLWHGLTTFVLKNQFWFIFALLFVVITATHFAHYLRKPKHRKLAARFLLIHRRISCHWFSLFVMNGFTAWISTMTVLFVQQFSWTQIVWSALSDLFHPVFQMLASFVPGAGILGQWFHWYGDNQPKFLFWLLYSAAICDDLGLPNYKALIRWGLRRLRRSFQERLVAGSKAV
jgi:hypothetical protein